MKTKLNPGYETLKRNPIFIKQAISYDIINSVAKSINAINRNNRIQSGQHKSCNNNSINEIKNSNSITENIYEFDKWAISIVSTDFNSQYEKTQFFLNNLKHIQYISLILRSNNEKLSISNSAIDDSFCCNFFSFVSNDSNSRTILRRALRSLSPLLSSRANFDFCKLRALFMIFYFPQLYEPLFQETFKSVTISLLSISQINITLIIGWLKKLPYLISSILNGCKNSISMLLSKQGQDELWLSVISPYIDVISLLYEANKQAGRQICNECFIVKEIDSKPNIYKYQFFPFVLSFPTRLKMIRYQVKNIQIASGYDNYLSGNCEKLSLNIHRNSFFEESKQQLISSASYFDYFRKLKVTFIGESAIDAGGPCREYLSMMAAYFKEHSLQFINNQFYWFKTGLTLDDVKLFGIIIGLAIANEVTLPIKLPIFLYKTLLYQDYKPSLDDLYEFDQMLANNLGKLVKMVENKEDISNLELTFDINISQNTTVPIINSMSGVKVTNENCMQYVFEYVNWYLKKRYETELSFFKEGFILSCPQQYLKMTTPVDLDKIVSGEEIFDWDNLHKVALYKDNLNESSLRIHWFWEVFENELTDELKLTFLKFTTGINRVPFGGLRTVKITIKDGGAETHLPFSKTCFNTFFLPNYTSKEQLKSKLILALQFDEGFGFQ